MKNMKYFILFLLLITINTCSDEVTVLSAIKDGEELEEGDLVPFMLDQNHPNPFNPTTSIQFSVSQEMHLTLNVYTEDWIRVATLIDKSLYSGYYQVVFNAKNEDGEWLPSGEYYYTLEGDGLIITRKMMLLK